MKAAANAIASMARTPRLAGLIAAHRDEIAKILAVSLARHDEPDTILATTTALCRLLQHKNGHTAFVDRHNGLEALAKACSIHKDKVKKGLNMG